MYAILSFQAQFKEHSRGSGHLNSGDESDAHSFPAFCVPFYSLMLALNRTKIDYFSLDVEGFEVPILKTIPFDQLDISVLTVEYVHGHHKEEYLEFMESQGYELHSKIDKVREELSLFVHDFVFVKKSL